MYRVIKALADSEQVQLNVGGYKFTTTVSTLRNSPAPSLFNAMFSGRHLLKTDDNGCFFLDRDGRHFHDILNYLRDGQVTHRQQHLITVSASRLMRGGVLYTLLQTYPIGKS